MYNYIILIWGRKSYFLSRIYSSNYYLNHIALCHVMLNIQTDRCKQYQGGIDHFM